MQEGTNVKRRGELFIFIESGLCNLFQACSLVFTAEVCQRDQPWYSSTTRHGIGHTSTTHVQGVSRKIACMYVVVNIAAVCIFMYVELLLSIKQSCGEVVKYQFFHSLFIEAGIYSRSCIMSSVYTYYRCT